MTVNKAMSELAAAGLIERRRRSGSFVTRPRSQAAILEIHDIRAEVEALGLPYRYERLSRDVRTASAQTKATWVFRRAPRWSNWSCRHFAGAAALLPRGTHDQPRRRAGSRGRELRERRARPLAARPRAVERGRTPIRAVAADEHIAKVLAIPRHAPCLVVQRRTWSADQPVTSVRLTYAGETHSLVARFAPREG